MENVIFPGHFFTSDDDIAHVFTFFQQRKDQHTVAGANQSPHLKLGFSQRIEFGCGFVVCIDNLDFKYLLSFENEVHNERFTEIRIQVIPNNFRLPYFYPIFNQKNYLENN